MEEKFYNIISNFFKIQKESIKPSLKINSLSKDSHDQILFTFEIEKQFQIEFNDEEIEQLNKVSDYVKCIKQKLQQRSQDLRNAA
jgi:acyl carrier protein